MRQPVLLTLICLFLISGQAQAYSYAAAGKEPFLDGWSIISNALLNGNPAIAGTQAELLEDELVNLESEADLPLVWPLRQAIEQRDLRATGTVFSQIFTKQIGLRLQSARESINDYQLAKVAVARSKRFLDLLLNDPDLLAGKLSAAQRKQASEALQGCMSALGSPGLFGSGRQPADPAELQRHSESLLSVLRGAD